MFLLLLVKYYFTIKTITSLFYFINYCLCDLLGCSKYDKNQTFRENTCTYGIHVFIFLLNSVTSRSNYITSSFIYWFYQLRIQDNF